MSDVIYANEDNDKKYRNTILKDKKKKDQEIDESVNNDEESIEYFVD